MGFACRFAFGRMVHKFSIRAKWRAHQSAGSGRPKKPLTEPDIVIALGKSGRGGTGDETVKPLDGIQRV